MPEEVTVLIIEDDTYLSDLIEKKLKGAGLRTYSAIDGEKGLEILKEEKVDIILLDLLLPGMHGFEFLKLIKSNPEVKDVPVVILSNLGQKEDIEKGLALGATDYLVKAGVTLDEIIVKINSVVKRLER